jgi:diguanylate cyclase (GGDEF)-like protein/PAS domain S-box-containing protein
MHPFKNSPATFSANFRITLFGLVTCAIFFFYYVHTEKQIDRANELRLHSYLLASELRQSSDDLTRMVQTYVATGNPIYKQHYLEILDIRDGRKPRPVEAYNVYWDLVTGNDVRPRPFGSATPLMELMREAGFSDEEFAKLAEAKTNSDELTRTEFEAMRLIEKNNASEADRARARDMLYDAHYQEAKARIMRPISEFYQMMNSRTQSAVKYASNAALAFRLVFVAFCMMLLFLLWRAYQSLRETLGTSADELHAHIKRIGQGDFDTPIPVGPGMENSVMGWLAETRTKLRAAAAEEKRMEEGLRANNEKLKSLYELSPVGITLTDMRGRFIEFNRAFEQICGYDREELSQLNNWVLTPKEYAEREMEQLASLNRRGYYGPYEKEYIRKDGMRVALRLNGALTTGQDGRRYIWSIVEDISDRKRHQEQLERIAHYDVLTGTPNRTLLADRMRQAIAQTRREQNMMGLCYLDLDGFKTINDTMGHAAGDYVLIESARRIAGTIRGGDTVARLGGDEFVVLMLGLERGEECVATLERLLKVISQPIKIGSKTVGVSASIGVSIYPLDDEDPDTLLRHADQAMYQAKQLGKNRFHIYDPVLDQRTRSYHAILNNIQHALERNEFLLHYQPKVELKTSRLVGAEALIRWMHPEKGLLAPAEFLYAIEKTDLDIAIGEWVIDTALNQMKQWRDAGLDIPVSVNISAGHLESDGFVDKLRQKLARYPDMPPKSLQIEVLETAALGDIAIVSDIITACREMGVEFALDDFGTGYSSLTYLSHLPVDTLKIDQSFVRGMLVDRGEIAIVQGIIALARAFSRKTVAEGVETENHYQVLLGMGCDIGQGYGIARPMAAEKLMEWRSIQPVKNKPGVRLTP